VKTGGPLLLSPRFGYRAFDAMMRHRDRALAKWTWQPALAAGATAVSSRRWADVIYRDELARLAEKDPTIEVTHTLTREQPGWTVSSAVIDARCSRLRNGAE